MGQNVFNLITEHLTNERLDDILLQNPEYMESMENIDRIEGQISTCKITEDARRLIGELISEYLTQNACYGKLAYQQGFRDCAELLLEIGLLKQPNDMEKMKREMGMQVRL